MPFCDRCTSNFGSERALWQHIGNSSQHNICQDCNQDFPTHQGLVQHYVQSYIHHYCQSCDTHFDAESHLHAHYGEEHHYCSACRKVSSINTHQALALMGLSNMQLFESAHSLEQHNQDEHWYCVSCRRLFRDENSLNIHLRDSSTHNKRVHACLGEGCNMTFIAYSGLAQHLESGGCNSGITRKEVDDLATTLDRSRIITNSSRLIGGPDGSQTWPVIMVSYATERSFNGTAYECILCHRTFRTLSALNAHLNSAAHADKIYRCPVQYDGCNLEFKTLSGLMQHAGSGSCGIISFQQQVNRALGVIDKRPSNDGYSQIAGDTDEQSSQNTIQNRHPHRGLPVRIASSDRRYSQITRGMDQRVLENKIQVRKPRHGCCTRVASICAGIFSMIFLILVLYSIAHFVSISASVVFLLVLAIIGSLTSDQ